MQLKPDQTPCTCMGVPFSPQETWFLAKKPSQNDSPVHTRNRSAKLGSEEKAKMTKRSLKKRPVSNSNLHGERQPGMGFVESGGSPELRIDFSADKCTPSH